MPCIAEIALIDFSGNDELLRLLMLFNSYLNGSSNYITSKTSP